MTAHRSAGTFNVGHAIWYVKPGQAELRPQRLARPGPAEALVRTQWSAVSRGTERLVLSGLVGESERERMRCPLQEGSFPFPVKYGYCATGIVAAGPDDLRGRTVFCLHPHQDVFIAPVSMLTPVPDGVPARRATLAANMETALNAHWDAGSGPGDTIVVVGAGIVGLLIAYLAARLPGADVAVVDIDPGKRDLIEALGARFVAAGTHATALPAAADVVFHASASAAGLATALDVAGLEARIVEMSWYGDKAVAAPLGGPFHSQRLRLVSSQVGQVAPSRRPRWSHARRLAKAVSMLDAPVLDRLVAEEIPFDEAGELLPGILSDGAGGLPPVIRYPAA